MIKKAIWVLAASLMVMALVLASCAPAAQPVGEKTTPPTAKEEAAPPVPSKGKVAPVAEGPIYGGALSLGKATAPPYFDEALGLFSYATTLHLTNESLLQGDWTKRPAGTGEISMARLNYPSPDDLAGCLAESWEMPDANTFVFHIRKGVRFHNKPPTNGREMTVNDVVFTFKYLWGTPTCYHGMVVPWKTNIESMTTLDKWTLVIKCFPGKAGNLYRWLCGYSKIVPHEVVEKYGNIADWRNSCGTGPFMLVDYVSGSSASFVRNPNYWMKDPLHPENQLPYLDGTKFLIIPDMSTQLAALRTGKIDILENLSWEDAEPLMKSNPELRYVTLLFGTQPALNWRVDTKPFNDIRVRQALSLAIDFQAIKNDFYKGHADILCDPIMPDPEFKDIYTPLDKLPPRLRELYEYHPDKAKQLLAEAGYPEGFKTEVVCLQSHVDMLSIVAAYWAKVGVDLDIQVKEYGVWLGIGTHKTHKQIYMNCTGACNPWIFSMLNTGGVQDWCCCSDPLIDEAYVACQKYYFDIPKRNEIMKGISQHIIEQVYNLVLPSPYYIHMWQPWVKGYYGEADTGFMNYSIFSKYVWLDQDMKYEMTGRR